MKKQTTPDLFQVWMNSPGNVPNEIKPILLDMEQESPDEFEYGQLEAYVKRFEEVGYTFEYYLDAEPYGLRKIGIAIEELGY